MIHILNHFGTLVTTLEYCLKRFSSELDLNTDIRIKEDGSMHYYTKEFHPNTLEQIKQLKTYNGDISSPVYPCQDGDSQTVLTTFKQSISQNDKVIFLIMRNNFDFVTAMIFMWHKMYIYGSIGNHHDTLYKKWNENYNSVDDMQPWEFREYLSVMHRDHSAEVIECGKKYNNEWMVVGVNDILLDLKSTVKQSMDFLNLTFVDQDKFDEFHKLWLPKQHEIMIEREIVFTVIDKILKNEYYEWNNISPMAESLIQFGLMDLGIELKVYGVDEFPTNTDDLRLLVA